MTQIRQYTRLNGMTEEEKKLHKAEQIRKWKENNKEREKLYYEARKEEKLKKAKEQRKENPEIFMLRNAKARALAKNLDFNIEIEDITIPEFCPILGIKLEISEGAPSSSSPSLDRIIPELGYTKGNVRVISNLANSMKANATIDQLIKFANWVLNNH